MDFSTTWPDGSRERWSDTGYQRFDPAGALLEQRALTDRERLAFLQRAVLDTIAALQDQARAAYKSNQDFLALPSPSYPLSSASQQALVQQVQALTRQVNVLIRLQVQGLPNT